LSRFIDADAAADHCRFLPVAYFAFRLLIIFLSPSLQMRYAAADMPFFH